jgi:hypothetical protein
MSVASRPVLEIQVKRTIAFKSTDKGFRSVVDQTVLTSRKPEVMPQKKLSAKLARSRLRGRCFHLAHTAYFGPITGDPEIDLPAKLDTKSYNGT